MSWHAPAVASAEQLSVPSLTVTLSPGIPPPGDTTLTTQVTLIGSPVTEELGVCPIMDVFVTARFTV
jgi:hypothetical protein